MLDVWVAGAYDDTQSKPAIGAWACPAAKLYNVTKRSKATGLNDGLRIGCAMAVLSAINTLGDDLNIHIPAYPAPRWVTNPKQAVPLPNLMYRLLYRIEVHPRLEAGTLCVTLDDNDFCTDLLHKLLLHEGVPQ